MVIAKTTCRPAGSATQDNSRADGQCTRLRALTNQYRERFTIHAGSLTDVLATQVRLRKLGFHATVVLGNECSANDEPLVRGWIREPNAYAALTAPAAYAVQAAAAAYRMHAQLRERVGLLLTYNR